MKFELSEAKYIIKYNHNDINSIRKALEEYSQLVISGDAFEDSYCVAHFQPLDCNIPLSFFTGETRILDFLKSSIYYNELYSDNSSLNLLTETLFFMCAATYPALELDIKSACESIVAYARRINDSAQMWITSEIPFGMEPLQIMANVYPQYSYLLAGFYVPNWDDEHMPEALFGLAKWSDKQGITDHTIKAFCYCDNSRVRESMLGYDSWEGMDIQEEIVSNFNLLNFFRTNTNAFDVFKQHLAERFKSQSFLQTYSDASNYIFNPVQKIILDIMMLDYPYHTWLDDFDQDEYLTQKFVISSAEEEIESINAFIVNYLGHAIVPSKIAYVSQIKKTELLFTKPKSKSIENWQLFILSAFPEGAQIWDYIIKGTNSSLLDSIVKKNFYALSRKHNPALYDELGQHVICFDDILDKLTRVLENVFIELHNPVFLKTFTGDNKADAKQILLRFIDVIFRWCDKKAFNARFVYQVCKQYGICEQEYFHKRYIVTCTSKLKQAISAFSGSYSDITIDKLDSCITLINENREQVAEYLVSDIFIIPNSSSEQKDKDESSLRKKRVSSKIDYLCLAIYLCSKDSQDGVYDKLTRLAQQYVECFAVDEILYDIIDSSTFPNADIVNQINTNTPSYFQEDYISDCKDKHKQCLLLEKYIRTSHFEKDDFLPSSVLFQRALSIMNQYMEFDDDEISSSQKQLTWLASFSNNTYKLLFVIHIGVEIDHLNCVSALKRVLSLAIGLAPIRTVHIIAKFYKTDFDAFDNIDYMLEVLDPLRKKYIPDTAYWAYQMGLFAGRSDLDELKYYHILLKEWISGNSLIISSFIAPSHRKQRAALIEGVSMLPRSTQLEIINDAVIIFPNTDFTHLYNKIFFDKIKREFQKQYKINDAPVYFKNKLQYKGIYCEYIEWNKWDNNEEFLNRIINYVKVEKPISITDDDCVEQMRNKKSWGYIVVQKQDDKLIPIFGHDLLYLIQNGFDIKNIYSAQTNVIIIDETCPQEHIDELLYLNTIDYRKLWIQDIVKNLLGGPILADVEYIMRCGVDKHAFLKTDNYFDICISDLIMKVNINTRLFALKAFSFVSPEALDFDLDISCKEYYDILLQSRVEKHLIFKFLVEKKEYLLIRNLALTIDLSAFILAEKIDNQINVISHLASLPQYHPLVLSLENCKSIRLQNHIKKLIATFFIKDTKKGDFYIVDYGIYVMETLKESTSNPNNKEVSEAKCISKTTRIKAEVGMCFGLRFTSSNPNDVPQVTVHTVRVGHPEKNDDGEITNTITSWQQNGYSKSNIFMGWYFETKDELLAGNYNISASDTDGNLLVEKCFIIE